MIIVEILLNLKIINSIYHLDSRFVCICSRCSLKQTNCSYNCLVIAIRLIIVKGISTETDNAKTKNYDKCKTNAKLTDYKHISLLSSRDVSTILST